MSSFCYLLLSPQSEAAGGLHAGIRSCHHPERGRVGILAAPYFANAPGGGVSPGNNNGASLFVRKRMN